MNLFNVYPLYDIEPVRAEGSYVWDAAGKQYLDLYGGHAVISIGHSHPHYVQALTKQLTNIGFYSNSVKIKVQERLAEKLGEVSGYKDYALFLTNSGAESNENALKLASFHNQRSQVIAFKRGFHGRTAGAVAVTDNKSIIAPVNYDEHVKILPFGDIEALRTHTSEQTCAVIVEGIQGVGGIHVVDESFMRAIRQLCDQTGAVFILDSVQCGYGRSGKFFTNQHYTDLHPDLITTAKGMGNGFPVGGVLISPKFEAKYGMLGTTFGGNHLACAASMAVLEVIENENLVENAQKVGDFLLENLKGFSQIKELRGRGLMIGMEFERPVEEIRNKLLFEHQVFTGAAGKHTLRLLPSLALSQAQAEQFLEAFSKVV
jgi:acetylornithine/N-succinyldiaminopimelate aminotransferase